MALDTPGLKAAIKAAFLSQQTATDANTAADNIADAMANAMQTFVSGITITYTAGLTTAAGGGPVTGTFTYTIS